MCSALHFDPEWRDTTSFYVVVLFEQFFLERIGVRHEVMHLHRFTLELLYDNQQREVHERSKACPARVDQEAEHYESAKDDDLLVVNRILGFCDKQLQPPISVF